MSYPKTNKALALIMICCLPMMAAAQKIPTNSFVTAKKNLQQVFVLFPHYKDAQRITVEKRPNGSLIYQEDIEVDTSQIIYNTAARPTRRVEFVRLMRRMQRSRLSAQDSMRFMSASGALFFDWGKWEEGVIPYKISSSLPQPLRDMVVEAILHVNENTNLCLRQKKNSESDFVDFIEDKTIIGTGQSRLGKVGGDQKIRFNTNKNVTVKVIVHEILHAAGFIHEQCRSDRDDFVEILFDNVEADARHNFEKDIWSRNHTSYDFKSIMHYASTAFGRENSSGDRMSTIRPRDSDNTIDPSSRLTSRDILGVNTLYPDNLGCDYRGSKIKSIRFSNTGALGGLTYERDVSNGWSDAAPIFINDSIRYMMFLNIRTSHAEIRTMHNEGSFSDGTSYSKEWTFGWAEIESLNLNNTTYILHHKRFPVVSGVTLPEDGLTRISRVNASNPFQGNALGSLVYEETWGSGWTIMKFFYVGNQPYIFRYNRNTSKAQIYKINKDNPFTSGTLGERVYNKTWAEGYTSVCFFNYRDKTYILHQKSSSGFIRITEISNATPFAGNLLGSIRFESNWTSGWDNFDIYTNNANGRTYLFCLKSGEGDYRLKRFKSGNAFSYDNPFEDIQSGTWTKGWSYAAIYQSNAGYRLLHMKK